MTNRNRYSEVSVVRLYKLWTHFMRDPALRQGKAVCMSKLYKRRPASISVATCLHYTRALVAGYPWHFRWAGSPDALALQYIGPAVQHEAQPADPPATALSILPLKSAPSQAESSSKEGGSTIFSPAQIREAAQKAFYTGCLMQIKRLAANGQLEAVIRYCDEAVAYAPVEA